MLDEMRRGEGRAVDLELADVEANGLALLGPQREAGHLARRRVHRDDDPGGCLPRIAAPAREQGEADQEREDRASHRAGLSDAGVVRDVHRGPGRRRIPDLDHDGRRGAEQALDGLRLNGPGAAAGNGDEEGAILGGRGARDFGAAHVTDHDHGTGDGAVRAGRVGGDPLHGADRTSEGPARDPRAALRGNRHRRIPGALAIPAARRAVALPVADRISPFLDQDHDPGGIDVVDPAVAVDAAGLAVAPADRHHDPPAHHGGRHLVPGGLADEVRVRWANPGEAGILGEDACHGFGLGEHRPARRRRRGRRCGGAGGRGRGRGRGRRGRRAATSCEADRGQEREHGQRGKRFADLRQATTVVHGPLTVPRLDRFR